MRTHASLLILCAAMAHSAFLAASAQEQDPDARASLSLKLDAFIDGAVEKGLLEPADQPRSLIVPPADEPIAELEQTPPAPETEYTALLQPCEAYEVLDFSDFSGMESYADLIAFRDYLAAEEGVSEGDRAVVMARAYIAVGLSAEALMVLQGVDDPRRAILEPFARMLEGRGGGDDETLRGAAACSEPTELWLAVAHLSEDEADGVDVLRERVSYFRQLPFQMRASVASIVVPALTRLDEDILASRIMADFTQEEISKAARLQFSQALLDFADGDQAAVSKVQSFLEQPSAQANAIQALSEQGLLPQMIDGQSPREDLVNFVAGAANTREEILRLQVVLDTLLKARRHNEFAALAQAPAFDDPKKTDLIRQTLIIALEDDLASASATQRLQAMDALFSDKDFIVESDDSLALLQNAAAMAEADGYGRLAAHLYGRLPQPETHPDLATAKTAFRRGDHAVVYDLASTSPDSVTLALLAGRSGVTLGDTDRVQQAEATLAEHPEQLLELIEADALSDQWLVSDQAYDQVLAADDPALSQRVARIKAIKAASMSVQDARRPAPTLSRANSILSRPVSTTRPMLEETS